MNRQFSDYQRSNSTLHKIDPKFERKNIPNTAEAWRAHFKKKKNERDEKKRHSKAPLWVLEPYRLKMDILIPDMILKVKDTFRKTRSLFWEEILENLYFVDEASKTVTRYNPGHNELRVAELGITEGDSILSFIIPVIGQNNKFVIGVDNKVYTMEWDGKNSKVSSMELIHKQNGKISCGRVGPVGRLVIGSRENVLLSKKDFEKAENPRQGITTSLEASLPESPRQGIIEAPLAESPRQGIITVLEAPLGLTQEFRLPMESCTGIAWNWKGSKIFIIDSVQDEIQVFTYNAYEGKVEDRLDSIKISELRGVKGFPRCLTCDTEDNLWIGCAGCAEIIVINPDSKEILHTITLEGNIHSITSLVFGHFNRDVLYLTTFNCPDGTAKLRPGTSSLYQIKNVGARALADYRVQFF